MIRASIRLALVLLWSLAVAAAVLAATILSLGPRRAGARFGPSLLHAFSLGLCRILGVRIEVRGGPPTRGPAFVTPNHWGYLDIFVLAALYRGFFVSRADVADWPLVGTFVRSGGTIFIRREVRRDAARVVEDVVERLGAGAAVTAFLEGGAGTGVAVRPFRSPLVQAAAAIGAPCVPVAIRYRLPADPGLDPAATVAWIDGGIAGHFMRLLRVRRIDARVEFLPARVGTDRKLLARSLEHDVRAAVDAGGRT
jgi:1-acyl-sn-glycerol-3-phosphate acyltransferase